MTPDKMPEPTDRVAGLDVTIKVLVPYGVLGRIGYLLWRGACALGVEATAEVQQSRSVAFGNLPRELQDAIAIEALLRGGHHDGGPNE